jgi:hypothetical protein
MPILITSFPVYLNQQNIRVSTYLSSGSEIEKQSQVDKPVTQLAAM